MNLIFQKENNETTDKESKDLRVTFNEKKSNEKNQLVVFKKVDNPNKMKITKRKDSAISRNTGINSNKYKTETLPDLNRNIKHTQKSEVSSNTKYNSFKKPIQNSNKLAITDGSNFPKKKSVSKMSLKDIVTASKTSRVFAPKLNKLNPMFTKKQVLN